MNPQVVAASAPPRVLQWLQESPDGSVEVLHRGPHALYLDVGGRCIGVVGTAAVAVPCAVRLGTPDLGELADSSARIAAGVLHLDDLAVQIGRLVSTQVPRSVSSGPSSRQLWPPPGHICDGSALLRHVGSGEGLTPEADDVLCGWLAIHRAAGVETPELDAAVLAAGARTTKLSATLLECAILGEVIPEFASWVAALESPASRDRARELTEVGHTSGAAMLRGAQLALSHLGQAA